MDGRRFAVFIAQPQHSFQCHESARQSDADDRRRRDRSRRPFRGLVSVSGKAILALADGRIFVGRGFGATGEAVGEVVFNTAMSGYQEVLTDPSYKGQLVCMTYPEIGNVGINEDDAESSRVHL